MLLKDLTFLGVVSAEGDPSNGELFFVAFLLDPSDVAMECLELIPMVTSMSLLYCIQLCHDQQVASACLFLY